MQSDGKGRRRLSHVRTGPVSGPRDGHKGMGINGPRAGVRCRDAAPRISICVPTYQGGRFLAETVRSALGQDSDDFEVVVLDNGSTDDTVHILAGFDDPRLRVHRNEETVDLPTNWRRVIEASRGRYVKLLCADDLLHHSAVRLQSDVLEQCPGVSLVASRRALIDEDGRVLARRMGLRGVAGAHAGRRVARRTVLSGGINPVGEPVGVMFRRADYDAIGGWDGSLLHPMDLDLWIRLLAVGTFYGQLEELAAFRVSATALSSQHSPLQYREYKALLHRICANPLWRISATDRMLCAVVRKLTYEAWPLRQRLMRPGELWQV